MTALSSESMELYAGGSVQSSGAVPSRPSGSTHSPSAPPTHSGVPAVTRGLRCRQKAKAGKRFLVTDTLGLLLAVHVVAAGVQERSLPTGTWLATMRASRPTRRP